MIYICVYRVLIAPGPLSTDVVRGQHPVFRLAASLSRKTKKFLNVQYPRTSYVIKTFRRMAGTQMRPVVSTFKLVLYRRAALTALTARKDNQGYINEGRSWPRGSN